MSMPPISSDVIEVESPTTTNEPAQTPSPDTGVETTTSVRPDEFVPAETVNAALNAALYVPDDVIDTGVAVAPTARPSVW